MRTIFLVVFLIKISSLMADTLSLSAVSEVRAKDVSYDGKKISLAGDVFIDHQFGVLICEKATLHLLEEGNLIPEKIYLSGNVSVELNDGSSLSAENAEIDCQTLEGYFHSKQPNKVVYTAFMKEGNKKAPVKTTSQAMRLKMKKAEGSSQYVFSDLAGEGSVSIEYETQR